MARKRQDLFVRRGSETDRYLFAGYESRRRRSGKGRRQPRSSFRWTIGNQVFLQKMRSDRDAEFVGRSWPSLEEIARFRLPRFPLDLRSIDQSTYLYTSAAFGAGEVIALTLAPPAARRSDSSLVNICVIPCLSVQGSRSSA